MIPLRDDQPTRSFPIVTLLIIAVNAVVFIGWQRSIGIEQSVDRAGFLPIELTSHVAGGWTHVFTSMFMHGGWMHLIGNMWFLWIFGNNIEDNCGPIRYLLFYLLCGIAAIFAQALSTPDSPYPIIGASGAISGVLGAYLLLFPRARVLTLVLLPFFFTTLRMPAMLLLLLWFAVQLISDLAVPDGSASVAFRAHIGGFLTGMLLVPFFKRGDVRLFAP